MSDEQRQIHVRLPTDLVRRVDHYAVDHSLTRPQAVAYLLGRGLWEREGP